MGLGPSCAEDLGMRSSARSVRELTYTAMGLSGSAHRHEASRRYFLKPKHLEYLLLSEYLLVLRHEAEISD